MALEPGILFAFLATISWGIGDFLIQRSVKKIGATEALAIIGIIGSIGLLPFVWRDIPALFLPENSALVLALGVITFAAAVLNFEAYKIGKLSVIEVVLELELPITVLLGILLFNENLSTIQIGIILLAFAGILLMSTRSLSLFSSHKNWMEKGVILGAMAAIGMGGVNFLTASAARNISPLMAIWAPWVIFTIFSCIAIYRNRHTHQLIHTIRHNIPLLVGMGIMDTLAWMFFAFATEQHALAITTAITESYPAIAMGLAITLNQEKIKKHQWIGALLAIGGSITLAFLL